MNVPRILIVDDDAALLQALPKALRLRMSPVDVDSCDSAPAGLERLAMAEYDAVVTDIKMPGMDGLALLERIQALQPHVPTLLITGHGEYELTIQALRGGAYDFIQKPIDRDYFVASLRRAIQMRQLSRQVEKQRQALRDNEERFRRIFQEAPIGMALLDQDERLLMVNQAFCDMLGYSEQELTSLTLEAITYFDDVGTSTGPTAQALEGMRAGCKVEQRYIKKNRETLWAELTVTVVSNGDGTTYRLAMIQDIFERKRADLLEDEQRHVAYELHDGLVQVAASAHLHLQAFAGHYRPRSTQARQELERALELAQRAAREARNVIAGLRPTVVEELGLATALRMQAAALRTEGWAITYEETLGQERLPSTLETALFRVALEALTNVRKHAHTTRARLAIEHTGPIVRLEAQDWGCGFQPSALAGAGSAGHFGLHEMRERIALLGGRFAIHSQPGAGTRVVVEVPLPMSETAPPPPVAIHDKANGEGRIR